MSSCRICALHEELDALPPRELIHLDGHWRVSHGWGSLEGWLVLCARPHVQSLDELDPAAIATLSPLLAAASGALREVVGCERTYVICLGELPAFRHLHIHVVPRMEWFTDADAGVNVFRFLQVSEAEMLGPERRDRLSEQLRSPIRKRLGLAP